VEYSITVRHETVMTSDIAPRRNYWAFGPFHDLAFILLTPLAILLAFTVAGKMGWVDGLVVFALASAMGHYLPGILRAYGDRALFHRYRARLIAAPLFLFASVLLLAWFNYNFVFLLVGLWGAWHWTMQVYGFARIYDARSGPKGTTPPLLERTVCILWFGMCVFVLNDVLQVIVTNFYESGGAVLPAESVLWFIRAWMGATAAVTVLYVVHTLLIVRDGGRPNPVKFIFILVTFVYLKYTAAQIDRPAVGYAMFEMWHDIQYLSIVWVFNLSRARKNPEAGGFIRFLFRPRAAMALAYVALCLAFGALTHAWHLFEDATWIRLAAAVVPGTAMLHYYLDGFIWRIREPETRAALGVDMSGQIGRFEKAPLRAFHIPAPVRHALLWLLILVPGSVLLVTESKGSDVRPPLYVYRDLVETFPNSPHAHFELGRVLQDMGQLREAREHFDRSLALSPNDYRTLTRLGALLADQGDLKGARTTFERALNIDSTNAELQNNLGIVLDELGELPTARVHLERALKIDPEYALAHGNLGIVLGRIGDLDGAVTHLERSLQIDPLQAPMQNSLGEVLLKMGRTADARTHFEEALRLEPQFGKARRNLEGIDEK
jgi:Flp pilus assembly protein TadD